MLGYEYSMGNRNLLIQNFQKLLTDNAIVDIIEWLKAEVRQI